MRQSLRNLSRSYNIVHQSIRAPEHQKTGVLVTGVLVLLFFVCGCETLHRKFVRKPKKSSQPLIVGVKEYDNFQYSSEDMYRQHFAYWQAYQDEAIVALQGNLINPTNYKRVAISAGNANKELDSMKELLSSEMADRLSEFISQQHQAIAFIDSGIPSYTQIISFRKIFEKNSRIIEREFSFEKMQSHIR